MKLKEIPESLYRAYRLSRIPVEKLSRVRDSGAVDCVVSLATIESRLPILHLAVRSLLSQTLSPTLVILWINTALENRIPLRLRRLEGARFKIRCSEETCAHRKLVETLKLYPETPIVTCDDDVMYPDDWLERLWEEHLKSPTHVVAHECRRITYSGRELRPYSEWPVEPPGSCNALTLAVGYGGVLYPPESLHPEVINRELYDRLAPKADDLWFKAMSLRRGTAVRRTLSPSPKPTPVFLSQRSSLKEFNVKADGNRVQWQQLSEYFDLLPGAIE